MYGRGITPGFTRWPAVAHGTSVDRAFDGRGTLAYLANVINSATARKAARPTTPMPRPTVPTGRHCSLHVVLAALAAGIMLASGPATAVLYKWVDANGRVSYSDQPPPGNVKAEVVGGAPPPSAPDAIRTMANQEMDQKKRQAQRADDQKKAEKMRADAALQKQACTEAQARIKIYEADQLLLMRVNEKGEPVYMDDATRVKERERLDAQIRERCAG